MSIPTYPDEKKEHGYINELDSKGNGSIETIAALVAEGESLLELICQVSSISLTRIFVCFGL